MFTIYFIRKENGIEDEGMHLLHPWKILEERVYLFMTPNEERARDKLTGVTWIILDKELQNLKSLWIKKCWISTSLHKLSKTLRNSLPNN